MSTVLQTRVIQQDFRDGMDRSVAPALISPKGVYDLDNALLDEGGNPYRRGGTSYKSSEDIDVAPVLDDFNRADENPVSQGGNWVGVVTPIDGDLEVVSNQLKAVANWGSAVYDQEVGDGVVYGTVAVVGAQPTIKLWLRSAGEGVAATLRGYYIEVFLSGIWYWALVRDDEEGSELLAPFLHQAVSNGDSLALKAVGAEISVWHKPATGAWTQLLTAMDATYEKGRMAVSLLSTGEMRFDDFGGGTLVPFSKSGQTWLWDGHLLPGQRTVFASSADFGTLASDDKTQVNLGGAGLTLPKQSAVLEQMLFIGGGSIYGGSRKTAVYSTGTVKVTKGSKTVTGAGTSWIADIDAGMLFKIGSERVYVVASVASDTELTLRDDYQGTSGEGKAYALSPLYTVGSDPYKAYDYMTVCANRLVLAAGRTIVYTEVNNPHSFVDSLGVANEHTVSAGVQTIGLTTVGQTVLVFTTAGISVLDGLALDRVDQNGNPQHRLQQLSSDVVLAGATGLAGSGQQVVVPAADGIFLMDGISSPVRVSKAIDPLYRKRIASGYHLGGAVVYRSHYFLPVLDGSANVRNVFVCRLDQPSRSRHQSAFPWSRFTGDGGEITAYAVRSTLDPRQPVLLGAQAREPSRVVDCSAYFVPDAEHKNDADGSTHNFDLITRDVATGEMTENVIRAVKLRYEAIASDGDNPLLRVYWSDGTLIGGEAEWGEVSWDEFDWAAEDTEAVFYGVSKDGPPNDGRNPEKFRINKLLRYGRFRFTTSGPIIFFALRSFEMDVRPSEAVRR